MAGRTVAERKAKAAVESRLAEIDREMSATRGQLRVLQQRRR